jgi:hypothetical protein
MQTVCANAVCLEAALEYLSHGWAAIPLCSPNHQDAPPAHVRECTRPGKGPLICWKTYQERLPTERELRIYFNRWPSANVGVVLGRVSQLIGVDIDGLAAETLWRELAGDLAGEEAAWSFPTPGGGRRLLFRIPPGVIVPRRRFDRDGSHVIILGEGSYTVMPPSVHPSGEVYSCG